MDDKLFAMELMALLLEADESDEVNGDTIARVDTFPEAGISTPDAGLVVTMKGGSDFQVRVVQSKRSG